MNPETKRKIRSFCSLRLRLRASGPRTLFTKARDHKAIEVEKKEARR
jgi:hypothetical protein